MAKFSGWAGRPSIISTDPATSVAGDYSAIAVLSHTGEHASDTGLPVIEVSHVERAQQVHHKQIIDRIHEIRRWLRDDKYTAPPVIVINSNGIGRALVERARETTGGAVLIGFIATGSADGRSDRFDQATMTFYASKIGHLAALDAASQAQRIVIPKDLKHGPTLISEAQSLRTKMSRSGRILVDEPDSRISQFDDILNTVSMGVAVANVIWTQAALARQRDHWPDRLVSSVAPAI